MKPVEIEFLMVDKLSSRLAKCERKIDEFGRKTKNANRNMDELNQTTGKVSKTVAKLASAFAMKELVANILKVRGQFQQLEVSFTTMLGSAERADALLKQLAKTAASTPFGLEEVGQGAKQLLAYGVEVEKINGILIQLGDIAAGLSIPLNDLVYLYGTTLAQGQLYAQDLNQFTNRGIPMIAELAKQFGVAESEVKGLVEAGKVGFPEVQKVIESLTGEGGKFGGLMEAQSRTITGQISNLEDAIAGMMNEIGQQQEGFINRVLSNITYVVENYERFGRILLGLVGTYGVYKTAVMAVTAAKGWATAAEALHYNWLLLVEKAQKMLNATMLANPYVLVATALAGVAVALISVKTEAERLQEAEEKYEQELQKLIEAEQEHKRRLEELCSVAGDEAVATATRVEALNLLEQKYPEIFAKYDTEYEKLKNIKRIKEEIAGLEVSKSITKPQNELKQVEASIKALEDLSKQKVERVIRGEWELNPKYDESKGRAQKETRYRNKHVYEDRGLTAEEQATLNVLKKKRESLVSAVRKNEINAYYENLSEIDDKTISYLIKQRTDLLALMKMKGVSRGEIVNGDDKLKGTFTEDELQYQLNKLRSEQNRRNLPTESSSDWVSRAKKEYDEALKAYNEFLQNETNDITQEEFEKKAKELKDAVSLAKKEYQKVQAETDKDGEKAKKEAERKIKLKGELGEELVKLQEENDEAEIKTMRDGFEKKLREIENEYTARINEINSLEAKWKRENEDAGVATGENGLTDEQTNALQAARDLAEKNRAKAAADATRENLKEEKAAMVEYLKQYGSFQQQKLAIAEEYAALIADVDASAVSESTKQWQKAKLLKEQKQRESSLSFENISRGIDWNALFSGIGNLTQEMLVPMMEQLQAYVKTDEYTTADAQTQQEVTALIQELRQYVGTDQSVTWKDLDQAIKDFTQSVVAYDNAKKAEDSAVAAREAGRQKLASGEISAEEFRHLEEEADRLGNATATARDSMEFFADRLNIVSDEVANFTSGLTTALNNAKGWKGLEGFSEVQSAVGNIDTLKGTLDSILPSLGDGIAAKMGGSLSSVLGSGLSSLGSGLSNIMSSGIGGMVGIVAQIPKLILDLVGAVKNMVVGILNSLTELISLRWIDDLVVSILDAVGELVNAIFDLPENLYKVLEAIVVDGIGGLLDTVIGRIGNVLSFGYLSSDGPSAWFTNSNGQEVAKTIERLTTRNETLQTAIEDLTSEIVQSKGTISVNAYKKAVDYQKENNQNYLAMAQAQAGYHSAHHSWNYYWGGFSDADIQDFSNQIGRSWDGNIWNLSPEEMKLLRGNVDMWAKIQNTGEGGYGYRVTEKLDDYIEQAGKLEELTDTLYEGLTGISFDGVYDSFVDSLMNMKYSAKDAAEDISEYFMRAMLSNKIGEMYADKLEEWWQDFGKAMEDGNLDTKEREELLNRYLGYVEDAQKLRDDIASATGYTGEGGTSQSGKSGAFSQSITYDQGTKLEGLFTSGQMHWASIDERSENISEKMSIAEGHLARIEENTGTCVKELKEIKEEVKKQNRDGLKMK